MVSFCYSARQCQWDPEMLAESTVKKLRSISARARFFSNSFIGSLMAILLLPAAQLATALEDLMIYEGKII